MAGQTRPEGEGDGEAEGSGENGEGGSAYRGDSSDYDEEIYPRSYRTPGRINLKKAMREYVRGHDRGWDQETKARMAEESLEAEASKEGYLGPGQALASGDLTLRVGGETSTEAAREAEATEEEEGRFRFGVGVPETLKYHRGADTWRDRVRELIHGAVQEGPDDERG